MIIEKKDFVNRNAKNKWEKKRKKKLIFFSLYDIMRDRRQGKARQAGKEWITDE